VDAEKEGALNHLRMLWYRLPESVRWGATLFMVVPLLFWLWGGLLMSLLPLPPLGPMYQPAVSAPPGLLGWALSPWNRWDVLWFTRIAVQGYGIVDGRSAFEPLFPLLISLLGRLLGGQTLIAAFLVSDACCLGSLILLYEIAQRDVQRGRRAVAALLLYPVAFFLFVPYNESLLLLLTLAVFLAARGGHWWLVGLCGALAVLTKVTAIMMLVAVAWELWERRQSDSLWNGLWLALLPLARVGWLMVQSLVFGTRGWLDFSSPYGLLTPFLSPDLQVESRVIELAVAQPGRCCIGAFPSLPASIHDHRCCRPADHAAGVILYTSHFPLAAVVIPALYSDGICCGPDPHCSRDSAAECSPMVDDGFSYVHCCGSICAAQVGTTTDLPLVADAAIVERTLRQMGSGRMKRIGIIVLCYGRGAAQAPGMLR
jgi:hypothetical protein